MCGKIASLYDYFALHDYIYNKPTELTTSLNNLEAELINIESILDKENMEDYKEAMKIALDSHIEEIKKE
jgi:hypothetical protein